MIKGNIIYFGYGDILVGVNAYGILNLTEIEQPKEIGSIPEIESFKKLQTISLMIKNEHLTEIKKVLNKEKLEIKIDNYILDFSNYNEKSIKVVENAITRALWCYFLSLAC